MGRAVVMVIEFTGFDCPRRIEETVHMSSMDLQGGLTFDPVPEGTRMRWSWHVEPRGMLKVMGPLVARMGPARRGDHLGKPQASAAGQG